MATKKTAPKKTAKSPAKKSAAKKAVAQPEPKEEISDEQKVNDVLANKAVI